MSSGIIETSGSQEEPQKQQNQPLSRTRLVQRLLSASSSLPNFIHDLILTQAQLVAGTEAAAFLVEAPAEGSQEITLKPAAHIRPDSSDEGVRRAALDAFAKIIRPCIQQGKDGAILIEDSPDAAEAQYCLVTLLRNEGNVVGASAVVTRCLNLDRAKQRLESMALVAGYFELFTMRRTSEQAKSVAQSHQHVLQLATSVATAEGFESAAMNLCNELATRTGAARVSLGWVKGEHVKLKALSHTEQFDKKQEMSVQIVKVMEECLDNDEIVQYEPDGAPANTVTREAQSLSRTQGGEAILSLPLRRNGEVVGIVTLEFAPQQKIGPQAATGLAVAVDLLAPQLYDRFQNDRWLITKAGLSVENVAKAAIGPKHTLAKLVIVGLFLLTLALCNWVPFVNLAPTYHVSAPFQFIPIETRDFFAPTESFLREVYARPGDDVKKGQLLLQFDDTEFKQRAIQYRGQENEARIKEREAENQGKTTERDQAEAQRIAAQAAAVEAELMVERTKVIAPFDGKILRGDLKDKIQAPFHQGDPIMVMAATGALKVEISVPERDIQNVTEGATGFLATDSDPTRKFPFTVERVVPTTQVKENVNVFTVYGVVEATEADWRDGLRGEVKIVVGERTLGWIWVHRFVEWLHMRWWTSW
jgi:hypothetical protein